MPEREFFVADIFNEVDEDVRKEKSLALWKAYGKYVIALVILIVAGTAAYVGWQNYQLSRAQAEGAAFEAASTLAAEGSNADAAAAFADLAEEGSKGYSALASLREAAALIDAGEGAKALAVYDRLAADSSVEPAFAALADLMAGYYLLDNGTTDQVRSRIAGLIEPGALWNASANELLALSHIKDDDAAKAREVLSLIQNDAEAPDMIKGRASQLLDALEGK